MAGTVTYTTVADGGGERFTEFYVLSTNETGAPIADDYPRNFTAGEREPLLVGVENHEDRRTGYTVVVELQRLAERGNETRVIRQRELDRFSLTLAPGESVRHNRSVEPTMTGRDLRLTFLLYRGTPPREPTVGNAYREVHLWIDVTESRSAGSVRRVPTD